MAANATDFVVGFRDGWLSVGGFLHVCRTYRGPAPHFLLSKTGAGVNDHEVFSSCLQLVPEHKMFAFLLALVEERPDILTLADPNSGGLLHLALCYPTSRRIHLLLAVPGCTRLLNWMLDTPLTVACLHSHTVDPLVIHRLIDLDPGVVALPNRFSQCALHWALATDPERPYVRRMIDLRPEALVFRDSACQTPVEWGISRPGPKTRDEVDLLRELVVRHPSSVAPWPASDFEAPPWSTTALFAACKAAANSPSFPSDRIPHHLPDLVRAVLDAHPPSLVIPRLDLHRQQRRPELPFEVAANATARGDNEPDAVFAFVRDETVLMALAVVEYALGLSASAVPVGNADNVAWFQGHIRDTLEALVPAVSPAVRQGPGLSVVQALLRRSRDVNHNRSGSSILDVVRAIFCHEKAARLLRGEARTLLLGDTVVDLYQLNRRGRYRPLVASRLPGPNPYDGDGDGDGEPAAGHQVELLASLKDSHSVESTYVQFRGVSHRALLAHGRRSGTRSLFGTAAISGEAIHPAEGRKRPYRRTGPGNDSPNDDDRTICIRSSKRTST